MQKMLYCLLLAFICNTDSQAQDEKKWQGFLEINFGVTGTVLNPNYSISSPYLKKPSQQDAMPFIVLKAGAAFKKKHFFALGLENIQMFNGFSYQREDRETFSGSGSTSTTPYSAVGLYYDYKVISFQRFCVLASLQTSLGFTEPRKDSIHASGTFYNPYIGVLIVDSYRQTSHEQKDVIFVYGVGLSCHFELIKEKLILGIGARFIHAPYDIVKSYHIIYKYDTEAPFDFYTSNGLMNMNFDLRLKYVF